jgi:hypothetical protein
MPEKVSDFSEFPFEKSRQSENRVLYCRSEWELDQYVTSGMQGVPSRVPATCQ